MSGPDHDRGWLATRAQLRAYAERMLAVAQKRDGTDPSSITKYLVLSTPRTGSTMLCLALERGGIGWPVEWFNEAYMLETQIALGATSVNIHDYVRQVILGTFNPELNVFGVNVHVLHYLQLKQRGYDLFDLGFDRVYYLHRKNKAKQAYSQAKSNKTGLWSRETEIAAGHSEPVHADVTSHEFCRALTEIVGACDVADTALRPRIHRTFCFEDLIGGGLGVALSTILADLGLGNITLDSSLPTEAQSSEHDRANLQQILSELGLRQL